MILCSNPKAQYLASKGAIDEAISRVAGSGRYILGPEVKAFESEFSRYIGVQYGVGVGSGTEAIHLALKALDLDPGDEVVTVSHTAVATVAAIEMCGLKPVLVDIDPTTYCMDPQHLAEAVTSRTRAIVPVHLYGQPADLDPIMEISRTFGLYIVEDCAQAHGALYHGRRVGSFGHMGCFSFYPTKNLGAMGDGGMIVTDNRDLFKRCMLLREYGWEQRYISQIPGGNSRLDEVQAAILRVKLPRLDEDNCRRQAIAEHYSERLGNRNIVLPAQLPDRHHVFHLYVVRTPHRDRLLDYLTSRDIQALIHYPQPIHLQPAFRDKINHRGLSKTDTAAREVLSLPIHPGLSDSQIGQVCDEIALFLGTIV